MKGTTTKRVSKAGKVSYLIRIDLGVVGGRRKRHVETYSGDGGKKTADTRMREIIQQFENGTLTEPNRLSVDELFEKWLSESAVHGRKVRTVESYRYIFECYIKSTSKDKKRLGSYPISKVTPLQIQEFVNKLAARLSPQTVRNVLNVLKVGFRQAKRWRLISFSPVADIDLPKKTGTQAMRALDQDGVRSLLGYLTGHPREAVLHLALASGARPGEYLALQWTDLNITGGSIKIERTLSRPKGGGWILQTPKTKKSRRTIPLPLEVLAMLKRHRVAQVQQRLLAGENWVDNGFVFTNHSGGPLNSQDLSREFKRILKGAKMDTQTRLYDLRHTCATLMLATGVNPKVAAERLGHSTVNLTLDTYSSVLPTMQTEATDRIACAMFGAH